MTDPAQRPDPGARATPWTTDCTTDCTTGPGRPHAHAFTHGVASGDVTSTAVVLWTRVSPSRGDRVPVSWSVRDEAGRTIAAGRAVADAADDHTCRVLVDDLPPGRVLRYRFDVDGCASSGTTRTLPARADHLRIAVVCCSRWGWPGFDRYGAVLDERPDLVLHLGDYVYEVGEATPVGGVTDPPHDCVTLDDYRRRYRQHRTHPSLQALHAAVPMLAVWDDHEVVDNAPDDETRARRVAGQRAWFEWMPTRASPTRPALDRRLTVDGLVDLVLVDTRFRGRPAGDTDGPATEGDAPPGSRLTPAQWSMVDDAARSSTAPWFVVANQVQVSPLTLAYAPARAWPPWRRVVNPDQWDGSPADRDRLVRLLGGVHGRPVLLSGDLHAGFCRRLVADGEVVADELTAPSISGTSFGTAVRERTLLPPRLTTGILRLLNPGLDHVDLERHGFVVLDTTPTELVATFVHHDGSRIVRRFRAPADAPSRTGTLHAVPHAAHRDVAQSG